MAIKYSWLGQLAKTEEEFNAAEAEKMVPILLKTINELQDDNFRLHARLCMALEKIDKLEGKDENNF
jgi:hypothetical protein